jgi:hypothetical protein
MVNEREIVFDKANVNQFKVISRNSSRKADTN